ncbi:MAG TPA: hypothetical protein VGM82_05195 [Gemmatimonadaceae bacterium]|jgi:hypothetical protein
MTTRRIGLDVIADGARIVLLHDGALAWSSELSISDDAPRGAVLQRLLASVPNPGWRRATIGVAVGSTWVQVKRLEGLPQIHAQLVTQVVRENATTFFLKRPGGIATSEVHQIDDGLWAAAFDRDVIDEIGALAREYKLRLVGIVPRDAALIENDPPSEDSRFACASAAANVDRRTPFTQFAERNNRRRGMRPHAVRAAMLVATAFAAAIAPLVQGALDERRLTRELAAARPLEIEAVRMTSELRRVSDALNQRGVFESRRGRMTRLLGAVARMSPESTAFVSLRADSADVNLVTVSTSVADLVPALSTIRGVASVRLVGAVAHDVVNGIRLERAALRIRLSEGDST